MLGNTFAETCKLFGTSPDDFSSFTDVPKKTLGTWFHTKPVLISHLFEAYQIEQIKIQLSELEDVKRSLSDAEKAIQFYKNKVSELEEKFVY